MVLDIEEQARKEQILAERRYIRAKRKKFELDQVAKKEHDRIVRRPFRENLRDQGLIRALSGFAQQEYYQMRDALGLRGFEEYVADMSAQIDRERAFVKEYEDNQGVENAFARDLYHRVRDMPQTKTYKDTRRAFYRLEYELAMEQFDIDNDPFHKITAWAKYWNKELISAAVGIALAGGIIAPIHSHLEEKDRNRPVFYKRYVHAEAQPSIRSAIASHNLEMSLNDIWNHNSGDDIIVARAVAQEWIDFLKPGANAYNFDNTNDEAGNDWTRPWGWLFADALGRKRGHLLPAMQPANSLRAGAQAVDASWDYDRQDFDKQVPYSCDSDGDGEGDDTCYRSEYDYSHHYFRLDPGQLMQGAVTINNSRFTFPELASANMQPHLTGALPLFFQRRSLEETQEILKVMDRWTSSVLITNYNVMMHSAERLRISPLPKQMIGEMSNYEVSLEMRFVHSRTPPRYPRGWEQKEQLKDQTFAVTNPYDALQTTMGEFDKVVPRLNQDMAVLDKNTSTPRQVQAALRDIADTSYVIHNISYKGTDWMATHGQRIFLTWLGFLGIFAGAGSATYFLLHKYQDQRMGSRMSRAGIGYDSYHWKRKF
jgi:hypothetical protein